MNDTRRTTRLRTRLRTRVRTRRRGTRTRRDTIKRRDKFAYTRRTKRGNRRDRRTRRFRGGMTFFSRPKSKIEYANITEIPTGTFDNITETISIPTATEPHNIVPINDTRTAITNFKNHTIEDLKKLGATALFLKKIGYKFNELKDAGYIITELKNAGFTPRDVYWESGLRSRVTAKDLKGYGSTAIELKNADYKVKDLLNAGFTVEELKNAWFKAKKFKEAGFKAIQLKEAGFTEIELKNAGFTSIDLKKAGFTVEELKNAGFTAIELKKAGFTAIQLKDIESIRSAFEKFQDTTFDIEKNVQATVSNLNSQLINDFSDVKYLIKTYTATLYENNRSVIIVASVKDMCQGKKGDEFEDYVCEYKEITENYYRDEYKERVNKLNHDKWFVLDIVKNFDFPEFQFKIKFDYSDDIYDMELIKKILKKIPSVNVLNQNNNIALSVEFFLEAIVNQTYIINIFNLIADLSDSNIFTEKLKKYFSNHSRFVRLILYIYVYYLKIVRVKIEILFGLIINNNDDLFKQKFESIKVELLGRIDDLTTHLTGGKTLSYNDKYLDDLSTTNFDIIISTKKDLYTVYLPSLLNCLYGNKIKEKLYYLIRLVVNFNQIYNFEELIKYDIEKKERKKIFKIHALGTKI